MSKTNPSPAVIQKSFVQQVQSIAAHTRGISDELSKMSNELRDGVQLSTEPTAELLGAANLLSAVTLHASASLSDCLKDLVSMGEAMTPVLETSVEAAPALLLNFFSTFVTQMNSFYAEMNAGWSTGLQGFVRGKAAFYRESAPATPRPAVSPTAGVAPKASTSSLAVSPPPPPPLTPETANNHLNDLTGPTTRTGQHKKQSLLGDGGVRREDGGGDAAGSKKKPGKKKAAAAAAALVPSIAVVSNSGSPLQENAESSVSAGQSGSDPYSVSSRYSTEDTMAALAAAAESGAQTAAPKRTQRNTPSPATTPADTAPQLTAEELDALAQSEPPYLTVTSTVEAALGSVVLGSRPNVFSQIASFSFDEPVSTYYIRLARPGSLAHFIFKCYLRADEETQADFLCDVLETDCAEVDPFTSPNGEVNGSSAANLSDLPPCAWSIGSSEDNERRLYTMYALMRQPPRLGPTAIIHDSLNMDGVRDEVVHMITLVDTVPQYAKVTCVVHSDVRSIEVPTQKQAAILSFSRSGFAQQGFPEVSEAEVKAALSRVKPSRAPAVELYKGRDRTISTTFQPPVQLASLDQPAENSGISFGGVARGAMQGGMEVLMAPFTAGRAVGGALMDLTGVTEAVRNNIEGLFRRSFPELAAETVVEGYNCAWMKTSMPTPGYVFITTHWLCFQSTVSAAKFSIEYDEIKDVVKSKSVKMFENALEIKTHLNETISLTSFLQRDQAYNALMKEWLKS